MSAGLPTPLVSASPGSQETDDAFHLLVEQVVDYAIFLLDPRGRVSSWNVGAQRISGYSPHEVLGSPFSVFFIEEDQAKGKPLRILEAAARDGRHEDQGWRVRKDGSRYWAHGVLTALHDHAGRLHGFAKITRDLTEHLKADEAARRLAEERAARAQQQRAEEDRRHLLRRQSELAALRADVSSAAISADAAVPEHAVRAVVQHLGVATAQLWLFDEQGTLRLAARAGHELPGGTTDQAPTSIVGRIAATGAPASSTDLSADPGLGAVPRLMSGLAFAGCPLLAVGRVLGVLGVFGPSALPDDTLDALRGVADVLGHSLERRRAELELRRSRDRLAVILATISDGVTAQSKDNRLLFANEAAARLTGFDSAAEMLTVPVPAIVDRFDIRDERGAPVTASRLPGHEALRTGTPSQLTVRFTNLGTRQERWAQVSAAPVLGDDGEVELAVNVFSDLTERKRTEEAWRFLAEASAILGSSLSYETSLAAVARLAVPRLADRCSVDVLSPDGKLETLAAAHADSCREVPRPADARVLQAVRTGAAQLGPGASMIVPLPLGDRPFGAMTFVSAETRRHYDQQDLILAQEIARRAGLAIDNAHAYREARAAVQMRDTFLSIASHELKTPMSCLTLLLSGLLRAGRAGKLEELSGDKIIARLERIEEQADRLTALMNQLLDVSRLAAGRFALAPTDTDLVLIAREVLARFQEEASQVGATLELVAGPPIVGRWDRSRLDQVLTNLVTNALKYGGRGPITVQVSGDATAAHLSVSDRGPGIPEADQSRIFEQYERAASTNLGGLGLGLWLVRELVRAHGGDVAVYSRPGEGAVFTVTLPRRAGLG